jgi:hypothetical protein
MDTNLGDALLGLLLLGSNSNNDSDDDATENEIAMLCKEDVRKLIWERPDRLTGFGWSDG